MFKVDVCLACRTKPSESWLDQLKYIPMNKLIIDTTKPLSIARVRLIQRVSTDWFIFLDDDVKITPSWFSELSRYVSPEVGAVQGIMFYKGLGEKWDKAVNRSIPRIVKELSIGERGFTHNTLIKTCLVQDWKPSRKDLSALEDYEITQHILRQGSKWLIVPVNAYHLIDWEKIRRNVVWNMVNYKKILPGSGIVKMLIKQMGIIIASMLQPTNLRLKLYMIYKSLFCVYGLLRGEKSTKCSR